MSRTNFKLGQFVQNIIDVAQGANDHCPGELFMAGGSVGGALTYKAAAGGALVKAIVCHNLYDFGNPKDTLTVGITRFSGSLETGAQYGVIAAYASLIVAPVIVFALNANRYIVGGMTSGTVKG